MGKNDNMVIKINMSPQGHKKVVSHRGWEARKQRYRLQSGLSHKKFELKVVNESRLGLAGERLMGRTAPRVGGPNLVTGNCSVMTCSIFL